MYNYNVINYYIKASKLRIGMLALQYWFSLLDQNVNKITYNINYGG